MGAIKAGGKKMRKFWLVVDRIHKSLGKIGQIYASIHFTREKNTIDCKGGESNGGTENKPNLSFHTTSKIFKGGKGGSFIDFQSPIAINGAAHNFSVFCSMGDFYVGQFSYASLTKSPLFGIINRIGQFSGEDNQLEMGKTNIKITRNICYSMIQNFEVFRMRHGCPVIS